VPLFIASFLTIRATGLKAEEIGLRVSWRELPLQILIGLSGLMLGLVEYLILRPESLVSEPSWEQILITVLILMVFTGFLEELIFRGLMQTSAIQALGQIGLMFVALVFSVLHIGYRSILDVIFVFTVAIAFGVLVQRYKSLLGVSIAHGLINVSLYLIFPFLFK
jgi:membrane protease YdiL (CAAX protease family)